MVLQSLAAANTSKYYQIWYKYLKSAPPFQPSCHHVSRLRYGKRGAIQPIVEPMRRELRNASAGFVQYFVPSSFCACIRSSPRSTQPRFWLSDEESLNILNHKVLHVRDALLGECSSKPLPFFTVHVSVGHIETALVRARERDVKFIFWAGVP